MRSRPSRRHLPLRGCLTHTIRTIGTCLLATSCADKQHAAYAAQLTNTADSVAATYAISRLDTLRGLDLPALRSWCGQIEQAAQRARRLAGDFDALTPPTDLARAHDQLGVPAGELATFLESLAAEAKQVCPSPDAIGMSGDFEGNQSNRYRENVRNHARVMRDLVNARSRIARALRDSHVALPELRLPEPRYGR
jgi:hypothetical protein